MNDARPIEGTAPEDAKERTEALLSVEGDVPLSVGSTPAPRKVKYPCRWCVSPKRKLYCHSHCPEYKEWVEQEEKRKEYERSRKTFTLSETGKRSIWRAMGRKK